MVVRDERTDLLGSLERPDSPTYTDQRHGMTQQPQQQRARRVL